CPVRLNDAGGRCDEVRVDFTICKTLNSARQLNPGMPAVTILDFGDWPGRIISGRGAVARLAEVVANAGATRALVVCGTTVAGGEILRRVKDGLGSALADVFAEAAAHTPIEMVRRGVDRFRATGADALVSVGGGSTIDAGKAIAIMLSTAGDLAPYAV